MDFNVFKKTIKSRGVKVLLRETTVYPDWGQLSQLYAEQNGALIGCYSDKSGGVIFTKPYKLWSKAKRTFEKVKI
jgi:hypothetical protein